MAEQTARAAAEEAELLKRVISQLPRPIMSSRTETSITLSLARLIKTSGDDKVRLDLKTVHESSSAEMLMMARYLYTLNAAHSPLLAERQSNTHNICSCMLLCRPREHAADCHKLPDALLWQQQPCTVNMKQLPCTQPPCKCVCRDAAGMNLGC